MACSMVQRLTAIGLVVVFLGAMCGGAVFAFGKERTLYTTNTATSAASASGKSAVSAKAVQQKNSGGSVPVYRLYDKGTGEHLFTINKTERDNLVKLTKQGKAKWVSEGIGWYAPKKSSTPVYRAFRTAGGGHIFTTKKSDINKLVKQGGWKYEGVAFYSSDVKKTPVYCMLNKRHGPLNNRHLTAGRGERDVLVSSHGWTQEGICCYATSLPASVKTGWVTFGSVKGYYHNNVRLKGKWLVTAKAPAKGVEAGLQRYWFDSKGALAKGRLINPKSGTRDKGAYLAYANSDGTILRNRHKFMNNRWYQTNNDGRLSLSKATRAQHINRYVNWAVGIAADDSHGYSQYTRWGPDYDCSSLVISSLKEAGFRVGQAVYTGNMRHELTKLGWKWYTDLSKRKRGDILLNEVHHTAIFLGNGKLVNASISELGTIYGTLGDQTGREILVGNYYDYPWNGFLRYVGK